MNLMFLCNILRILLFQLHAHPQEPNNFRYELRRMFLSLWLLFPQYGDCMVRRRFHRPTKGEITHEFRGDKNWVQPSYNVMPGIRCGRNPGLAFSAHYYGRPLSVSGRPCYILPMFLFIYFFMAALFSGPGERMFAKVLHVVDLECH